MRFLGIGIEKHNNPGFPPSLRMSPRDADFILEFAPDLFHNEPKNAPPPHGFKNTENLFVRERQELQTLDGGPWVDEETIVLWAYPGLIFCYALPRWPPRATTDPGPLRIVTDRNKKRLGMIYHINGPDFAKSEEGWQVTIQIPGMKRLKRAVRRFLGRDGS
ncbi:hypothetical protein BDV19DRAFT_394030 [Aspergillus venezuelensis]